MENTQIQSLQVPFWPEDGIEDFGEFIPVLCTPPDELDKDWPIGAPDRETVIRQLGQVDISWFQWNGRIDRGKIYVLAANYEFDLFVRPNRNGSPRFWLGRIGLATNENRSRMLRSGVRIRHRGFRFLAPYEMTPVERNSSYIAGGRFATDLIRTIGRSEGVFSKGQPETRASSLRYAEEDAVETLQTFIDAEFELEERVAQQEPGFFYRNLRALPRSVVYRQFYEVEFDADDYRRMLELKPMILAPSDNMGLPGDLRFEVTDLEPDPTRPIVHLSIERQTEYTSLPYEGQMLLSVVPTLHEVRSDVLRALREERTANPWLLSLLADKYNPPAFKVIPLNQHLEGQRSTKSQREAIDMAASVPDYGLILGPPGTGKTSVIVSLVKFFTRQHKRVLIAAQSNTAVDNVLERLVDQEGIECIRVGSEARISSTLESILLDNKARDLQAKLFSEFEASQRYFEMASRFINILTSNLPEITAAAQGRVRAIEDLERQDQALRSIRSEQRKVEQERTEVNGEIGDNERRIRDMLEPRWPRVLEKLRKVLNSIRLRMARRRLQVLRHRFESISRDVLCLQGELEVAIATRAEIQAESINFDDEYRRWFRERPDNFVDEIRLPEPDSFQPYQLESVRKDFESLQDKLGKWYSRLRGERQQFLYPLLLERVDVVGATCVGINTRPLFRDMKFDVVIVDEAGQVQAHNLIVPLSRADRTILVGDHNQLPPVAQDSMREEIVDRGFESEMSLYDSSWFECLWDRVPDNRKVMLNEQFRCPSVISEYISEAFYDGRYFASPTLKNRGPLFRFCPGPLVFIDTRRIPRHYESGRFEDSRWIVQDNRVETRLIVELLKHIGKEQPQLFVEREVGVIVPYRNHVARIHHAIRAEQRQGRLNELDMPLRELVATIDSFQGQERELIILPFTRSNRSGNVGFLREWRRMNVALTRAKRQLIAIGDTETLTKSSGHGEDAKFKKATGLLVRFCGKSGCLLDGRPVLVPSKDTRPSRVVSSRGNRARRYDNN